MSTAQLTIEEPQLQPPHEPPIAFLISGLALMSIPGALLRIWIQQVFTFEGTPLNPVAIPQILGCYIAGLVRHSETLSK